MPGMDPSDNGGERTLFRFADIEVDTRARTVTRAGIVRPVEPKAFEVLRLLVSHPNEVLTHEDLLGEVWNHRFVSPRSLTRLVSQLRRALGDDPARPRCIRTRHSLGYCFIAPLLDDGTPVPAVSPGRAASGVAVARRDRRERRGPQDRRHVKAVPAQKPASRAGAVAGASPTRGTTFAPPEPDLFVRERRARVADPAPRVERRGTGFR